MKGITVAVWGSPGSGKTTLSAAVANAITSSFGNVLLVGADQFCPCYAQWYPDLLMDNEKQGQPLKSLGHILEEVTELTQERLRQYIYLPRVNDCLGIMGYLPDQSAEHNMYIEVSTADRFLELVRTFAEVTIIDCSNPRFDCLSLRSLELCDLVLYLVTPTPKGLGFVRSMSSWINLDESAGQTRRLIISPQFPNSDHDKIETALGGGAFAALPYLESVYKAEREKIMLKGFGGKSYQKPVQAICRLIQAVFEEKN